MGNVKQQICIVWPENRSDLFLVYRAVAPRVFKHKLTTFITIIIMLFQ